MTDTTEERRQQGCLGRFKAEWNLGVCSLEELDGRTIDATATFQPQPRALWIGLKAFVCLWSISVLFAHLSKYDFISFYLAYSSHWLFLLTIMYQLLSLLAACLPAGSKTTPFIFQSVSCLGPTVAGMGLLSAFLFWSTDRQFVPEVGETLYNRLTLHGIFALLVLLDLLVVNRSPVRPKHILGMYLYVTLYMLWMVLHAALKIGNPRTNGEDIDNGLSWANKPVITTFYFLLMYLVFIPLAFALLYFMSGGECCGMSRRYTVQGISGQTKAESPETQSPEVLNAEEATPAEATPAKEIEMC